ncbi:hypothetical protein M0805_009769 [Coniferiporia weirii]|nr:hypothetical protein M0805_009769 [Coniferiporia weirii]
MDKCSTDVAMLILDYACASDPGSTARRLGLVSKYFRTIAEPLEFRTLVIAGPDQLRRVRARLKRMQEVGLSGSMVGGAGVNIQHLFISDLKMEHALALDAAPTKPVHRSCQDFWDTDEGIEASSYYRNHGHNFWNSSSALVRSASATLITITALQGVPSAKENPSEIFSGVHLPRLNALTLKQTTRITSPEAGGSPFVPPTVPSLRRLHLIGVVCETMRSYGPAPPVLVRLHPLLEDMHSRYGALTHLIINNWSPYDSVDTFVKVIHGSAGGTVDSSVSANVTNRQLPGKLISAVLQLGKVPIFFCGNGLWDYEERIENLIGDVKALGIDGLKVHLPTPTYPGEGNSEYEVLLAEWKTRALD